jgi:hypothetical protein
MSNPLTNIDNCSARIVTLAAPSARGQRKLPFSGRCAPPHNPLPSHASTFHRVWVRLVNKNRWPLSESCPKMVPHQTV